MARGLCALLAGCAAFALAPIGLAASATPASRNNELIAHGRYDYDRGGLLVEIITGSSRRSIEIINVVWPRCDLASQLGFLANTSNGSPLLTFGSKGLFHYSGVTTFIPDNRNARHDREMKGEFSGRVVDRKTIALNVLLRRAERKAPAGCTLRLWGKRHKFAISLRYTGRYTG